MADINTQKFTNVGGDNLIVIPDTTGASNGDVLTYNTTSGIVWKTPEGGGGPEPTPGTDPIENLDISETIGTDGTMTITPNGDTSTLDHYNVNVYGEG